MYIVVPHSLSDICSLWVFYVITTLFFTTYIFISSFFFQERMFFPRVNNMLSRYVVYFLLYAYFMRNIWQSLSSCYSHSKRSCVPYLFICDTYHNYSCRLYVLTTYFRGHFSSTRCIYFFNWTPRDKIMGLGCNLFFAEGRRSTLSKCKCLPLPPSPHQCVPS